MHWYLEAFKKYADFSSRSSRAEFWMFMLINGIILAGLNLFHTFLPHLSLSSTPLESTSWTVYFLARRLFWLVIALPTSTAIVRRLHDTDRSGWWGLLLLLPLLCWPVFTVSGILMTGNRHDDGESFLLSIFTSFWIVGILETILALVLLTPKGTPGPNRFGSKPD